ncbi:Uncharacterised protein [Burkholderia pseudomallei]|nr:Uncharacterised protein [Burkholderia pseudomallei]CAJ4233176.1 Uncharacterised protein [Burkholderia pseudomallei]CAK0568891.1 Uncharacterised protein [Burkholderia pseudomallei]
MEIPEATVENIEAAIRKLAGPDSNELRVPALGKFMSFFADAGLLQLVITWAREASDGKAKFDEIDCKAVDFAASLEKLLGRPYALAAWVMAKHLLDANGQRMGRSEGRVYSNYVDAMDEFDFPRTHPSSEGVNLLCVQGSPREFIRPLYEGSDGDRKLRQFGEVRVVVQAALAHIAQDWPARKLLDISEAATQLTRELVENSDWWARADERGVFYAKGIRAITFRLVNVDDDHVEQFSGSNTHVRNYLIQSLAADSVRHPALGSDKRKDIRELSFIELSIVDSGPGLARRWLSNGAKEKRQVADVRELTIEEEEEAVVACFRKWATSSGDTNRGIGLFAVARLLRRRNGFLRLRTGRLSFLFGTRSAISDIERRITFEQQDASQPYLQLEDKTHVFTEEGKMLFFLRPWTGEALGAVEGTSFSILLPA